MEGTSRAYCDLVTYQPPTSLMQVLQQVEFDEALQPGDPRYVPTVRARGSERTFRRLARKLGWDPDGGGFFPASDRHLVFFGHIGSGKSTELRRYLTTLRESGNYFPVEVNSSTMLDTNNLAYSDVLLAMLERLLDRLRECGVEVADSSLRPVTDWFASNTRVRELTRELGLEVKAGAEVGGGLPGLLKLVAGLTSSFRTGATTKTEMREEIRNRFTTLADAFNVLIRDVEVALRQRGLGSRVVFLVDGTDKMRGQETERFFIYDAEQLLAVRTLAIYTAPLHLKYDGRIGGKLDADLILPMIKLFEPTGGRYQPGWQALTDLLLRRADRSLFASTATIELLIEYSGGHPRELLHLLRLSCEVAEGDLIDEAVARAAIAGLAADYRRWLLPDDYVVLEAIDAVPTHVGNEERAQELLHRLALMEYNDGSWRRSHPVIRTLPGYTKAAGLRA